MTKLFETIAQWAGFFAIVEEGCKFGFGGAGGDSTHDLAVALDPAVGWWFRIGGKWWLGGIKGPRAEEMVSSRLWERKARQLELLEMWRTMLLAVKRTEASGWVAAWSG
jgi:hypothetical protein